LIKGGKQGISMVEILAVILMTVLSSTMTRVGIGKWPWRPRVAMSPRLIDLLPATGLLPCQNPRNKVVRHVRNCEGLTIGVDSSIGRVVSLW